MMHRATDDHLPTDLFLDALGVIYAARPIVRQRLAEARSQAAGADRDAVADITRVVVIDRHVLVEAGLADRTGGPLREFELCWHWELSTARRQEPAASDLKRGIAILVGGIEPLFEWHGLAGLST